MMELYNYENMVIDEFKDDIDLCRLMVKRCIEDYQAGECEDLTLILLNLKRIVKARGYKDFEVVGLSESQINNAIKSEDSFDLEVINKMFEALEIDEQI